MPVALKHRAISRQDKMAFSAPVGLSWDSPPPPTECADGRTYGCTDVRTDGHVTITSQPKFLGLIGYHISLAMELRWRALLAGSAINTQRHWQAAKLLNNIPYSFYKHSTRLASRRAGSNNRPQKMALYSVVAPLNLFHAVYAA